MTLIHSIVPSAMSGKGHDWSLFSGKTNPTGDSMFASLLGSIQAPQAGTDALGATDPIAQIASLIRTGTPLPTIINEISQDLGRSIPKHLSGTLPPGFLDRLKSSIIRQIGNALSPPGTAPPGTPKEQARALAARLQRLVASIARDATDNTGQLNEIAGNVLDAKSAKELPAQTGNQTASALDVSSIVSSLLENVLATLQSGATTAAATRPNYVANPLEHTDPRASRVSSYTDPTHEWDRLTRAPQSQTAASQASAYGASPSSNAPFMAVASTDATPLPGSSNAPSTPSITMENAPDLLARMLVRASGVDAKISGNAALSSATSTQTSTNSSQAPSAILARFEALIASAVQGDVSSNPSGTQTSGQFGRSFDQQLPSQTSNASNDSNAIASAQTAPASNALQNAAQAPQATFGSLVDANAVIEQMIKGMAMRTNSQGTSEIHLHLQPENLGEMTMKITVTGSQITANVVAQNADVRGALLANHQQLARSLANSGLTLSGFSVDVSGGDAGSRDQQKTAGFGRHYVIHELHGKETSETPALSSPGPALLSGKGLELFSYLV